ncbi:HAD-IA family hydrolase [Patescibacteria group bacterium]|nr:HAD-IA family hydrolase [Patescibacteria group bacterium]
MQGIRALLLDVDGTILDTREYIFQATEHAFAENGFPIPTREMMGRAAGKSFDEYVFFLAGRRDFDPLPIQTSHRVFQLERLDLSVPFPGALETLTELKKRGYKLATITNRGRSTGEATLHKEGMDILLDTALFSEDAPELKPSPVPLQIALDRMHLVPEEAVMIGDADVDIEAGKRAGVATIRATYGFHFSSDASLRADTEISDIRELLNIFK